MKKQFLIGYIAGAVTFGAIGAFAAGLVANPNPFPVTFDGDRVFMEGYNIEGSTYFKLRDIAGIVGGFNVDFADDTIVLTSGGQGVAVPEGANSAQFDDCYITIKSAYTTTDTEGRDCLAVVYDYTNQSGQSSSMLGSIVSTKAYQNGIEIERSFATYTNGESIDNSSQSVQNGATLEVTQLFILNDNSPVTVEATDWYDNIATATYLID